jgi:hypothetical protein
MNCVTVSHFERAVELSIDVLQWNEKRHLWPPVESWILG